MSKSAPNVATRARKPAGPIHFDHTARGLTSYAGLIPVIKFLDKQLGFTELFQSTVDHQRAKNATYSLGDVVLLVLAGLIGGATSLRKCVALWSDGVLRRVAGWVRVPDDSHLGRMLKEVSERHINDLETLVHVCRDRIWQRALRSGASRIGAQCVQWIDGDSTVKTLFGRPEGAAKGYNPHKKGALSYHPLLAFSAHTKEILQGWLRTGNAYTSNGIVEFMKQLLAHLPGHIRIIFRADSGFFVGPLLELLDQLGHGYLIKVKMSHLEQLLCRQYWCPIPGTPGWEQAEFTHQAHGWSHARIFVAVRQRKPLPDHPQGELLTPEAYDFFCYTTSEPLSPWQAHRAYGQRATSETWIEEAKGQMALAHLKTDDFLANAVLFQTAILAYNTLRWMALLSGNAQLRQWEPESLRTFVIRVAGQLRTGGNQLRIRLAAEHLYPAPWRDWLALA